MHEYRFLVLKEIKLMDRLDKNLSDFRGRLNHLSRTKLIEQAAQIAAVAEVYSYMSSVYEWRHEDEVDYFLLFADPLTLVADIWAEHRGVGVLDVEMAMWKAFGDETLLSDYPLDVIPCGIIYEYQLV